MRIARRDGRRLPRSIRGFGCESLESRLALTFSNPSSLLGSLSYVGVVTTPIETASFPPLPANPSPASALAPFSMGRMTVMWSKLRTDLQTLQTELQSLAAKSGLTISDIQNLTNDSQAITQAGFYFRASALNPVISELATAVAGNTSTAQAQTDFSNLFTGSSVASSTISTTFNDLVKAIQDSAVTTTDLSTVAADEAAIQSDLPKLPGALLPNGQAWLNQVGDSPLSLSLSTAVTSAAPIATLSLLPILPPQPIIISPFGGTSLLGSLASVGVVTSPVFVTPTITVPPMQPATAAALTVLPNILATYSSAWSKLQADIQTLHAELQTLAEKSGLTIADEQSLTNDSQAIAQAGFHLKAGTLDPVISELATAVAGGTSTSQAQTDFTALFSGSNVSSTTITNTFNDLTKAIKDSAVTTNDLSTVAGDQAAIQTDLKNLFPGRDGGTGSGSGTGSGTTGTSTGSGGATGSGATGSTSGHKKKGHHAKVHHALHVAPTASKMSHAAKVAHSRAKQR